ncbi:MAG: M48 family metallopeptidase [Xanthomonadaceae bacterium]|nr:M48 family metallopeptidase [Xanthomonadaceae bacterium]
MSNIEPSLILITLFWISMTLFDYWVERLDLKGWKDELPSELKSFYDQENYTKSKAYHLAHHELGLWQTVVSLIVGVNFLQFHGFERLDQWVRSLGYNPIYSGLVYFGVWAVAGQIIGLPFRIISTFRIESKFGFNRTTVKTFITDMLKALVLGVLLGGPLLGFILWFFERYGFSYWAWVWGAIVMFQLLLLWVAPVWILPLFNKMTPLTDGELKNEIQAFATKYSFELSGIFTMDGSKRSTKANAFFTGFGKLKRIVLFDTLIAKHTVTELVAVLAHEIGHYRLKHIQRQLIVSVITLGATLWLFSLAMENPFLFLWFGVSQTSTYLGLLLFSIALSPISRILGLYSLSLSRKYEFEADRYSIETYSQPEALVEALKRLSVENLSNLTPHPLKVFLEYTHPPVLQRLSAIRKLQGIPS